MSALDDFIHRRQNDPSHLAWLAAVAHDRATGDSTAGVEYTAETLRAAFTERGPCGSRVNEVRCEKPRSHKGAHGGRGLLGRWQHWTRRDFF